MSGDTDDLATILEEASAKGIPEARRAIEGRLLGALPQEPDHRLIIAVNQLEQLWTSVAGPIAESFLNFLAAAEGTPRLLVLATVRDDFATVLPKINSAQDAGTGAV